jgi:hypothetical protein
MHEQLSNPASLKERKWRVQMQLSRGKRLEKWCALAAFYVERVHLHEEPRTAE